MQRFCGVHFADADMVALGALLRRLDRRGLTPLQDVSLARLERLAMAARARQQRGAPTLVTPLPDMDVVTLARVLDGITTHRLSRPEKDFLALLKDEAGTAWESIQRDPDTTSRVTVPERAAAEGVSVAALQRRYNRRKLDGHHDPRDGRLLVEPVTPVTD